MTYVFESIAIMEMSKNLEYKAVGTAWIPFYNKYLLGKIVGISKERALLIPVKEKHEKKED